MNKKAKDRISSTILDLLYDLKKALSCHSINQYLYYEYYQNRKIEFQKDELRKKEYFDSLAEKKRIYNAIYNLEKSGLIRKSDEQISITPKGEAKCIVGLSKKYKSSKKTGKNIYLVIFDIPEQYRRLRALLRVVLYNFGGELIQKSVFLLNDHESYKHIQRLVLASKISDFVKFFECRSE